MNSDLRRILKSVSRSFYLSLQVLPQKLRTPISLAYLLARASDTIADTPGTSPHTRLRRIGDFEGLVRGVPSPYALNAIQRDIVPDHMGEAALMKALPQVLEGFGRLSMWEWRETSDLLGSIIRGQSNDLEFFNDETRLTALPDSSALEDYIYLVAGCVGEWWTRLCFHHIPNYSHITDDELLPLSNGFGKALQLVNILRDMPVDLANGRCYLPADELHDQGVDVSDLRSNPAAAQPVYYHWLNYARTLLDQGRFYILSIRPPRVRFACYVPWRLACDTLELLMERNPLETGEKVKVPRSGVRAAMWTGMRVAFSNKPLK